MKRFIRTTASAAALVLATAGAIVAAASVASATIVERSTTSFAEDDTFDDCGFPLHLVGLVRFQDQVREVKQSGGQAFNLHEVADIRETYTNLETGRAFGLTAHELFMETRARRVDGNVWSWTVIEAGVPLTVTDQSGRVVMRDRGVIRYHEVADTLGDGQPGGIVLSFDPVRVSGPHPIFVEGFDLCAVAEQLTTS